MMKTMRKVLACTLVLTLVLTLALGSTSFAMADTYPSLPFRLPAVLARPTAEPEPEVTEAPAEPEAPVVTEAPAEPEAPVVTEAPAEPEAPVVTETPAEPEAPVVTEAPAEPEAPVVTETPAEPEAPVVTEAPAEEEQSSDIVIRLEASGLSEIIESFEAGDPVTAVSVHGDWVKVIVAGVEGYVYKDDIAGLVDIASLPVVEAEENTSDFKVTIFSSRRSAMTMGEPVYLTSKLEGFEGYETKLQWQCDKGNGFEDIPGADADTYSFAASVETLSYDWRLVVYYR